MGLDICVRRILKRPKDKDQYFRLIDNDGNYDRSEFPNWTKPFEKKVIETWNDWKKFMDETGIDVDQCEVLSIGDNERKEFTMTLWPNSAGECPCIEDFTDNNGVRDWDKYEAFRKQHIIEVNLDKVPTYQKEIKVLYYEEVGYQRKGLNEKFYEDYRNGAIGYFVWTKEELERYKELYCDDPYQFIYPNGDLGQMVYPKDDFQKNIIDNFVEGKDCVIFDW